MSGVTASQLDPQLRISSEARPALLDDLCLRTLVGRFGSRVVQRCADGDLDAPTVLERCDTVHSALRRQGIGRGCTVALKSRRDSWLLPTLLGVLRSGAAYTVIPFNAPDQVEEHILQTIAPAGVMCWDTLVPKSWQGNPRHEIVNGPSLVTTVDRPQAPVVSPRTPDDICYVISTSGTTGVPKCVAVPHRAATAFLGAARSLVDPNPSDVIAARSSAAFDLSVWELFGSLATGATSVLVVESVAADVARLHALLSQERCTVLSTTPSAAYQLGSHDAAVGGGLSLRRLLVGGEAADGRRLQDVLAAPSFAGCRLDNWYGPTEATVSVTGGSLDAERLGKVDLTIGAPLPGVRPSVIRSEGRSRRTVRGELALAGEQLAYGYLGNPRVTAASFVPDPDGHGDRRYLTGDLVEFDSSGWVTFRGRQDNQVQLRGHRLELTEVERVIAGSPGIRWAHARVGGTENDVLVGYYATRSGAAPVERGQLWNELYRSLPKHAVPAALVEIAEIPISVGEKLASDRLPNPAAGDFLVGDIEITQPATDTEYRLLEIWQRLLDIEDIGTNHHFLALGGHSLLVARLFTTLKQEFGTDLSLSDVVERLTIRDLAAWLDDHAQGKDEQ